MKRVGRIFKRTVLASLCAATALGVVGVPGAQANSRPSNSTANVYVVKPGEWLARIASNNGVALNDLLAINGFQRTTVIHPGQTIKLPGAQASSRPSNSTANVYVVRAGDSLSGIASRAGVTLNALLTVNGFQRSSVILPGQTIKLPAGASLASPPVAAAATAVATPSRIDRVLDFARAQIGKPYRFGAAGPDAYDCSGLVRAAFRQIGITLPHSSLEQSKRGTAVDWRTEPIRPGDLVFTFSSVNPTEISHVGIAVSSTQWIEAPFTGADVRLTSLPNASRIQAVRRLVAG